MSPLHLPPPWVGGDEQRLVAEAIASNWLAPLGPHVDAFEREFAEIIDRILYFDGAPNMQKYMKINVGKTVPEQFAADLEVEYQAVPRLNKGIEVARAHGDNGTRSLLEAILKDEEEHVDWLEAQLGLIKEMGAENYLAQQMA